MTHDANVLAERKIDGALARARKIDGALARAREIDEALAQDADADDAYGDYVDDDDDDIVDAVVVPDAAPLSAEEAYAAMLRECRISTEPTDDAVRAERDDLQDRLLRMTAEFDNYRKRVDRERRASANARVDAVLTDVLSVVDDLDRALAASDATAREGVAAIQRRAIQVLARHGVTPFDAVGLFDPTRHHAIAMDAIPGIADGHVAEVSKGYVAEDGRVLRPASVRVSTGGAL